MNDPASTKKEPRQHQRYSPLHLEEDPPESASAQESEPGRNWFPWIVACIAILVLGGIAVLLANHGSTPAPLTGVDPYAGQLAIQDVHLSQASNFAGDQLTYVDGTVTNRGNKTVTGITVRVLFANDEGEQPQVELAPLTLIRSRDPYVDTVPVSAAPLKPGASQDFRLTFDDVSPLWNQQAPRVEIQRVTLGH